ncbi:MAG: glycosyltransferase [Roseburia sp.]|nr:glycosyltransferase [Roseburia sp.]
MTTADNNKLKVLLICHSDLLGGASVVTYRLMQALRHEGVDARMLVYTKLSSDPSVALIGNRSMRGVKFMTERLRIMLSNGFKRENLFKVSIANVGYDISNHPWVQKADVICLSWINQGLLSLRGIRRLSRLGKPLVWVMHDMWCLTGICHHAYACTRFCEECGKCPLLGSTRTNDLSHTVWMRKKRLYAEVPIHFVAVSNWLAAKCAESSLLKNADVNVIPNAFPIESFDISRQYRVESYGIDYRRSLIVMGAARLDDPIKGFNYAIEALNFIFDNHPEVARNSQVVFFGALRNPAILDRLRFPYVWTGLISDPRVVREFYSAAKVVISTSLYETLPSTLIEGQAAGCLPVTFGRGGQSDIITHLENGYVANYLDSISLAEGIMWALKQNPDRQALHDSVGRRFGAGQVARRFIDLFNRLLKK